MAIILNKYSMLFLLATTLLICSSYADDHVSSAGVEERAFISKQLLSQILPKIRSQYGGVKKGFRFWKKADGSIDAICTRGCHRENCDGNLCLYTYMTNNKRVNCEQSCSEERSAPGPSCYYDFNSGKVTGRC